MTWQNQDWKKALHHGSMKGSVCASLFSKESITYISFIWPSGLWHTPTVITFFCSLFLSLPQLLFIWRCPTQAYFLGILPTLHLIQRVAQHVSPLWQKELVVTLFLLMNRTPLLLRAAIVPDKRSRFPVSLATGGRSRLGTTFKRTL